MQLQVRVFVTHNTRDGFVQSLRGGSEMEDTLLDSLVLWCVQLIQSAESTHQSMCHGTPKRDISNYKHANLMQA